MRVAPRIYYRGTVRIDCNGNLIDLPAIDLSLFAVKVQNRLLDLCKDFQEVSIHINLDKETALKGKIFRTGGDHAVILFNEDDEFIAETVGEFLTREIERTGICPYCKAPLNGNSKICKGCGMNLDFTNVHIVRALKEFRLGKLISRVVEEDGEFKEEEDVEFIGASKPMKEVFKLIRKYATTDYPVLITGETGTGKELTARAIHERSIRKNKPFIAINCTAVPPDLLEAELFGYEKGAFTGAYKTKQGKVELADGGTLFLDEIGDMPLDIQSKLLRFLQDYSFERLGGTKTLKADVRIIAATNVDLERAVKEGRFREDLFYRLNVLTIKLPPLRERGEDVVIMAQYFLERSAKELNKNIKGFTDKALEAIRNYTWPGNVRELINVVRKACVLAKGDYIDVEDLNINVDALAVNGGEGINLNLEENINRLEKELLEKAFRISSGNVSKIAALLGVSRPTVYKLMEKYGIGRIEEKQ